MKETTPPSPPLARRQFLAAAAAAFAGGGIAATAMAAERANLSTGSAGAASVLEPGADPLANTARLQKAIDDAAMRDDPRVVIPPGRWEITTLFLRSRVHLELALGAVLTACPDIRLFPQIQREFQSVRGKNILLHSRYLLYAENGTDIAVTGRGAVDGGASDMASTPSTWDPKIRVKSVLTSPLIEFRRCQRVTIRDISVRASPGWTIHLFDCDDVRVEGVAIDNDLYGIYNDGLDINGCRNVFVSNCFVRACDDTINLKSTRDARSCEYITVTNCVLETTCTAVGIGGSWNSIRYVTFSNCAVRNAIRMIALMCDGGTVEHVVFSNIAGRAMTSLGTDRAIHFDVQPFQSGNPQPGTLRHVIASNITCETRGRILLTAQAGATMSDITLRDVRLAYPEVEDPAVSVPRSGSIELSNFSPEARVARAAVVADNISGLVLENIAAAWPADASRIAAPMHALWGRRLRGGVIDCPLLAASDSKTERYDLKDSDVMIRG